MDNPGLSCASVCDVPEGTLGGGGAALSCVSARSTPAGEGPVGASLSAGGIHQVPGGTPECLGGRPENTLCDTEVPYPTSAPSRVPGGVLFSSILSH